MYIEIAGLRHIDFYQNSARKNQMALNMITKLIFFRASTLIRGPLFELFQSELFSEADDNGIHEEFLKSFD